MQIIAPSQGSRSRDTHSPIGRRGRSWSICCTGTSYLESARPWFRRTSIRASTHRHSTSSCSRGSGRGDVFRESLGSAVGTFPDPFATVVVPLTVVASVTFHPPFFLVLRLETSRIDMDWRGYKQLFVMIVMYVPLEKQVVPDRNVMNSTVRLSPMDQTSRFTFGQVFLKTCRLRDVIPDSAITNRMSNMEDHLIDALSRASSVDMAVSFLRESGYTILGRPLSETLSREARVHILTGTYPGITSPFVLEELIDLKGNIKICLFPTPKCRSIRNIHLPLSRQRGRCDLHRIIQPIGIHIVCRSRVELQTDEIYGSDILRQVPGRVRPSIRIRVRATRSRSSEQVR